MRGIRTEKIGERRLKRKKLAMLIHLRDVVIPQQEVEKERKRLEKEKNLDEEKRKKREYYHIQNQKKYWKTHVPIYHTNDMEREMREEDLYTEYELHHIEELYPEESGRIDWSSWFRLVNEYRSKFENERSWKHESSLHDP